MGDMITDVLSDEYLPSYYAHIVIVDTDKLTFAKSPFQIPNNIFIKRKLNANDGQ